ncbi:site-specific integrase [Thalassospira sp.]|uniref:tyrosine-type recombinase/integrase n=1 Tax=Thalassospira sp. TaxID=1912094 RepID=UPI001B25FBAD|nr:site-specific integrase [Thalassospira sp.]MBO6806750.1 tyrosine-type recombinase/integrase [Thalassospira sp.]MBO6840373.1 tyrosine-type recombinase/integrase [Thalassospira sp.]
MSSWKTDKSNITRHIVPLLGRRKLHSLSRNDVVKFQRDVTEGKTAADERTGPRGCAIVKGGSGTAARATAVLGAVLAFAVSRGLRDDNPARGVKLNKQRQRERFLSDAEFARLGDALAEVEHSGVNASAIAILRLLILTGARRSEICGLKWEWIDFDRATIRLPDSKTGAKSISLGAPALDVLATVKQKT